jgi:hypothetical protein
MSRSRRCLVSGVAAIALAAAGLATITGMSMSTAPRYEASQCPPGYQLNPQNTQQCVPTYNPYGTPQGPNS